MAMGLGLLGRGAGLARTTALLCAHAVGGVLGGVATGAAIGAVGAFFYLPSHRVLSVLVAGAIAMLYGVRRGVGSLGLKRQVPQDALRRLGVGVGYFWWGVQLGTGVATRISHSAFILLVGIEASADIPFGAICGGVYGATRAVSAAFPQLSARYREQPTRTMHLLTQLAPGARWLNLGTVLVGTLGLSVISAAYH